MIFLLNNFQKITAFSGSMLKISRHIHEKRFPQILTLFFTLILVCLTMVWSADPAYSNDTQDKLYSLNLYYGEISKNHADDFILDTGTLRLTDCRLAAVTLARRLYAYKDLANLEVEGQIVKHFYDIQDHWEFNAIVTARWNAFFWDKYVDTSIAFGLGPSYATEKPEMEAILDRETSQWLAYWMVELEMGLPAHPGISFITRLHHRSDAFRIVSPGGASTAPVVGLKIRF